MKKIAIVSDSIKFRETEEMLASQLNLPLIQPKQMQQYDLVLQFDDDKLMLQLVDDDAPGPVYVDFLAGKYAHRRKYGGGKSQLLAKAVGLQKYKSPSVLDLTAGLGQDAFILASLGCKVQMIERSPIISALVTDALQRAEHDPEFSTLNLKLWIGDSMQYLLQLQPADYPDIIFIDPMFPSRIKSALVKKEMRVLRAVVGDDLDADKLFELALKIAQKRVVVKRPRHAPCLTQLTPNVQYRGESSRFDVYSLGPQGNNKE